MIRRPNPVRWLAYAYGAGLPAAHREWVLFDVTTRTWVLRHFARATVQLAPLLVAVYLLLPVPTWIGVGAVAGAGAMGYFYSTAYLYELAEHRAVKAGYPRGTAAETRAAARAARDGGAAADDEQYARLWREPTEHPDPS